MNPACSKASTTDVILHWGTRCGIVEPEKSRAVADRLLAPDMFSGWGVIVGDEVNENSAWSYPTPKPAAAEITGYIAFETRKRIRIEA